MLDVVAVAGAAALTEGVKFLFGQVTEVLRRFRERRDQTKSDGEPPDQGAAQSDDVVTLPAIREGVLDGEVNETTVPADEVSRSASSLLEVRRALADYADGLAAVSSSDATLAENMGRARALLEALYGQHVTLVGESGRPRSGTPVVASSVRGSQSISASGQQAVAAETISGQVAIGGGINVGGAVHGGIHTGRNDDSAGAS